MAIILAVANEKGGCGKTTTTMNLAGGLTKAGYRVLVVDADPQASATMWSLARGQSSVAFDVQTFRQLRGRYRDLAESTDYDIALVDCPPGVTERENKGAAFDARMMLKWADTILVPLRPSTLDFSAAGAFVRYLEAELEPHKQVLVLINGRQPTRMGQQAAQQALVLFAPLPQAKLLKTSIGLRTAITEVSGSGKTIFDYAPGSPSAEEYFNLTKEILQWLKVVQTSLPSLPSISSASRSRLVRASA